MACHAKTSTGALVTHQLAITPKRTLKDNSSDMINQARRRLFASEDVGRASVDPLPEASLAIVTTTTRTRKRRRKELSKGKRKLNLEAEYRAIASCVREEGRRDGSNIDKSDSEEDDESGVHKLPSPPIAKRSNLSSTPARDICDISTDSESDDNGVMCIGSSTVWGQQEYVIISSSEDSDTDCYIQEKQCFSYNL